MCLPDRRLAQSKTAFMEYFRVDRRHDPRNPARAGVARPRGARRRGRWTMSGRSTQDNASPRRTRIHIPISQGRRRRFANCLDCSASEPWVMYTNRPRSDGLNGAKSVNLVGVTAMMRHVTAFAFVLAASVAGRRRAGISDRQGRLGRRLRRRQR